MSTLTKRNTFTALTTAESAEVNENFDDLVGFVNNDVVHTDGTKAMTGLLTGPAMDPSDDNHLARKKYVDDHKWSADDITSGTLPVERGGTGAASAAAARAALGIRAGSANVTLAGTEYGNHVISAPGIKAASNVVATVRYSGNGSLGCNIVSITDDQFTVRVWTNSGAAATLGFVVEWVAIG